jgi:hypothetical protein
VLLVVGALSCALAARTEYQALAFKSPMDFYQHWAVIHASREHLVSSAYTIEGRSALGRIFSERVARPKASRAETVALDANLQMHQGALETVGTPALYAALSPFVTDDFEVDLAVYRIAQIFAVVVACLLFSRMVDLPVGVGFLVAAWALVCFPPVGSDLRVENVSIFQWLWLGVPVALSRTEPSSWRDAAVGAVLGLAVTMKPNLALVLVAVLLPLVLDRRTRALVFTVCGTMVGALACFVASAVWFGSPLVWVQWARSVPRIATVTAVVDSGNYGLVAVLHEVTHHDLSKSLLLVVAAIAVFAVARSRRDGSERGPDEVLFATALGAAATALVAPIFWLHYCVLLVPAAFVGWRFAPRWTRWGSLVAMSLMSGSSVITGHGQLPVAVVVVVADVTLFALTILAWVRARTAGP